MRLGVGILGLIFAAVFAVVMLSRAITVVDAVKVANTETSATGLIDFMPFGLVAVVVVAIVAVAMAGYGALRN